MHVLIVEDDLDLGRALQQSLAAEGLSSEWVRRGAEATRFVVRTSAYDCVLLDLSLPDGAGLDLLRRWRQAGLSVPVIIITAQSALDLRLAGLEDGADDFVLKPFVIAELIARVRAVVRRYARQASDVWRIGPLEIQPRAYTASIDGKPLELSLREFNVLLELARDHGAVVSKRDLSSRLEPMGDPVDMATIEVHVSNLRRKVGAQRIVTVRGVGYMLAVVGET
ncbi:MAG: response regulator [Pseudomonadota bacterium]|jgi:DNA-binding response OmpR family regulator|uniref:response regulator n=1 Tax=Silanimonas sp. TaxID=1929290 RepID=UPI0022BA8AF6|nr:response regulator transcription factor [Silanimonas sp.]MCZ8116427.1 response regulator transcription factor [Silanimonas sp.]